MSSEIQGASGAIARQRRGSGHEWRIARGDPAPTAIGGYGVLPERRTAIGRKSSIISKQRTDQLVTTSDTARAALLSDEAGVGAAVGATKADRARLAQTQLQLSFTNVVAPIAGRAGAVMVKAGNIVRDSDTTLVTLLQLSPIYVTFGVPEQILTEVQRLNAADN